MLVTTRSPNLPALDGATFERRINRLFNDVLGSFGSLGSLDWQYRDRAAASSVPPVDIVEEKDAIRIMTELAGVKPENVKISLENNLLTIQGTKEQVAEQRSERVHRYERTYGTFERSFTLPTTVDADRIQASYEHGVLTVTLPKAEKAKPREIAVQVESK